MATLWRFEIQGNLVKIGSRSRRKITKAGCNEPFKDRYWCPKQHWFRRTPCPFVNLRECDNFEFMCGVI